jgi:hypothetical protein
MLSQVLFNKKVPFKGADDLRDTLSPMILRGADYPGILSLLLNQKARAVSLPKDISVDNPRMDIYKNVDTLRAVDRIPMGSRCLRSLLTTRN